MRGEVRITEGNLTIGGEAIALADIRKLALPPRSPKETPTNQFSPLPSPHIDRLASEGARYTRAYVTASLCSPIRSALITGMYQTSLGAHHHRTRPRVSLPGHVKILTHYFRAVGYFTSNALALNWGTPQVVHLAVSTCSAQSPTSSGSPYTAVRPQRRTGSRDASIISFT